MSARVFVRRLQDKAAAAILAAVIVAAALGALGGSLFPARFSANEALASTPVTLRVHPGATSTVNCWWHGTCYTPPTHGTGMDWRNTGTNPPVYWRSFGFRGDGQNFSIGTGLIQDTTGGCNEVQVTVTDAFSFPKGAIIYTHSGTWTPGWTFPINGGGPIYGAWTQTSVGFSKWPDVPGCPATDQHLHEDATPQWTRNTSVYPSAACYAGDGCTPLPGNDGEGTVEPNFLNGGNEQYSQLWSWG